MPRGVPNKKAGPVPTEIKPAPAGASRTGETVTVACKMPMGIIIHREVKKTRPVVVLGGGTRDETYYERVPGSEVEIIGNSRPIGGDYRTRVVMGYALTQGVPKDLWDHWAESHADLPALKNRLLFAMPSIGEASDAARESKKVKSGLEPLNPAGDPRRPRPLSDRVRAPETRDDVTHEFEEMDEEPA